MGIEDNVTENEISELREKISADGERGGYSLNPDGSFTNELIRGLIINERRYGYMACPCRLASGEKDEDLDIICPCDYRDADLNDYDACFCALYVSKKIINGDKKVKSLPDRREEELSKKQKWQNVSLGGGISVSVWRCTVCGYLAAREAPPAECPICKVPKERFELFLKAD